MDDEGDEWAILIIFCASICITVFFNWIWISNRFNIQFEFNEYELHGIQFACNIIQYFHSNEIQFPQNQLNFLIVPLSLVLHNNISPKYPFKKFLSCIREVGPSPTSRNNENVFSSFLLQQLYLWSLLFLSFFVINLAEQTRLLILARNFVFTPIFSHFFPLHCLP